MLPQEEKELVEDLTERDIGFISASKEWLGRPMADTEKSLMAERIRKMHIYNVRMAELRKNEPPEDLTKSRTHDPWGKEYASIGSGVPMSPDLFKFYGLWELSKMYDKSVEAS